MPFIDAQRAVNYLGISRPTFNRLVKEGRLKPLNFEGEPFLRIGELKKFKMEYKRNPKGRKRRCSHAD